MVVVVVVNCRASSPGPSVGIGDVGRRLFLKGNYQLICVVSAACNCVIVCWCSWYRSIVARLAVLSFSVLFGPLGLGLVGVFAPVPGAHLVIAAAVVSLADAGNRGRLFAARFHVSQLLQVLRRCYVSMQRDGVHL